MLRLTYFGLFGGAIAAMFAIVGGSPSATVLAIGLTLASVEIMILVKVARGFTPVVIPILTVNFILLSSLFFWDRVQREARVGAVLLVDAEYLRQAAMIGIVFSAAYSVGTLLGRPLSADAIMEQSRAVTEGRGSLPLPTGALLGVGYSVLFLTIYAYQGAILRSEYQQANGPDWAVIVGNALSYVAMLALCIAAARPGPWRTFAILGIALWALILFGRGTRNLAALPSLILLGRAPVSGWRIPRRGLVVAAVATVLLLQFAIFARANPEGVGVIPLAQILTKPGDFFGAFNLNGVIGNFLVTGPLTAVVAQSQIPSSALWISLNPMPGGLAGWPEIQKSMRINIYTPYNTLGELGAHGWVALVAVAGTVGFTFSLATRIASNLRGAYAVTANVFVLAIIALYSAMILQYNLRSTTRFAWYAIFGLAALWFAQRVLSGRRLELDAKSTARGGRPHPRVPLRPKVRILRPRIADPNPKPADQNFGDRCTESRLLIETGERT